MMIGFLLAGVLILLGVAVFFLVAQSKNQSMMWLKHDLEALRGDLKNSLNTLINQVNERLKDNTSVLGERLGSTEEVVRSVKEHLGRVHEASTKIYEISKDISSLQEILRAPKIRGGIGEFFLEGLLSQVLPKKDYYQMQYAFKNGQQVDAVIKLGAGRMVPIDSKFPLENFRAMLAAQAEEEKRAAQKAFISDVKRHISDISEKYIRPDEGTFDFALMYIPAENVYYETIIKDEKLGEGGSLFNYALGKKVIPVSPNSFYAYLQVILVGLKGMTIEKGAQQILAGLDRLRADIAKFYEEFAKLGRHIENSRGSFDDAEKRLRGINEKVTRLSGLREDSELPYDEQKAVV